MATRRVAILLVALATTLANQQDGSTCGCQQQPVVIQMSCGSGQRPQPLPPPPQSAPAPAPAPAPEPPAAPAPAPPPPPPAHPPGFDGPDDQALTCVEDNDLIIALDESGSVGEEDFKLSLAFAANLAGAMRDQSGNRVAVLLFSHVVRTYITLQESATLSSSEIQKKILAADYQDGGTSIDVALDACRDEILNHARTNVPRNVVFLTDGSSNEITTERAAHDLYQLPNVQGYSVGVGQYISHAELLSIAMKNQNHLFTTDGYDHLLQLLRPVSMKVCNY